MKQCLEEMELDLFGVVVREVAEVLVGAEVGAGWEAHVPGPGLVGIVSALIAELDYRMR